MTARERGDNEHFASRPYCARETAGLSRRARPSFLGNYLLNIGLQMCDVKEAEAKATAGVPANVEISPEIVLEVESALSFWMSEHWSLIVDGALPGTYELALELRSIFCN